MRAYEELPGAKGRRIFYRPERFDARQAFGSVLPTVEIDEATHTLDDLSMTGLSATGVGDGHEPGANVVVKLRVGDALLHEGAAHVRRVDNTATGARIAMQLDSGYLDVPRLVAKHHELMLERELNRAVAPDTSLVPVAYRQHLSDILFTLREYRDIADKAEARIRAQGGDLNGPEVHDFLDRCEARLVPAWNAFWTKANALVEPVRDNPDALAATKRYTERVLTPELMGGPIWRRSYEKPLGYPGDFQIMNQVYDWKRLGKTLYDKLQHRLGLENAACVASRADLVRLSMDEEIRRAPEHVTHIASLGCGSAREVIGYLDASHIPGRASFTLIDQDQGALSYAYERTYPAVMRHGGEVSVQCLNASFIQLLRTGELFGKLPPQDMIYSVGLVDYFQARRAKSFIAALYEHLAPGGLLIIGNLKHSEISCYWPMEFICDWTVVYRTDEQMRALAEGLEGAGIRTQDDASGRVCMLYVRKPV
jgi:extracellular factor (EF) 3-hydroxypalmitic acid methyl ester biosynthesis protein